MKEYQPILKLRPTQFSIGVDEVEAKVQKLRRMKPKKRLKFLEKRPVPVVISPLGELFIIDHHHLTFTCWHAGFTRMKILVVQDYSQKKLTFRQFWNLMRKKNYAYLYDQFGEGPRSPIYLPRDIRGLADDPYRSLAWLVKTHGGYDNSDEPFAEFQWADFFRKRRLLDHHARNELMMALSPALRAARSKSAIGLPGYRGRPRPTAPLIPMNAPKSSAGDS